MLKVLDKEIIIELLKSKEIKNILNQLWISHLYLVWSYSRWDHNENSDIDLVYEKLNNFRVWWIKFIRNKSLLEEKLKRKIDLVNINYIYNDIKPFIQNDKILIY